MQRLFALALLFGATWGLSPLGAAPSVTSDPTKSGCGCVDCRCPDCNGEFCTCGEDCQCGSCGCQKLTASSKPATATRSCCSKKLARKVTTVSTCGGEVCQCTGCDGENCTCENCQCGNCSGRNKTGSSNSATAIRSCCAKKLARGTTTVAVCSGEACQCAGCDGVNCTCEACECVGCGRAN